MTTGRALSRAEITHPADLLEFIKAGGKIRIHQFRAIDEEWILFAGSGLLKGMPLKIINYHTGMGCCEKKDFYHRWVLWELDGEYTRSGRPEVRRCCMNTKSRDWTPPNGTNTVPLDVFIRNYNWSMSIIEKEAEDYIIGP
jgi:hypothetical protein